MGFMDLYLDVLDATVIKGLCMRQRPWCDILAREGLGYNSNPEDDGGRGLADYANANHIKAGPVPFMTVRPAILCQQDQPPKVQ